MEYVGIDVHKNQSQIWSVSMVVSVLGMWPGSDHGHWVNFERLDFPRLIDTRCLRQRQRHRDEGLSSLVGQDSGIVRRPRGFSYRGLSPRLVPLAEVDVGRWGC
jgi:hypothetical protein